jgi:hypothetical protein
MSNDLQLILDEVKKTIKLKHDLMERVNQHLLDLGLEESIYLTKKMVAINDAFHDLALYLDKDIKRGLKCI